MAPAVGRRYDLFAPQDKRTHVLQARNEMAVPLNPWMMILIIIGVFLVVILVVFVALYFARKRRRARELEAQADPMAIRREGFRRRKPSAADQAEAEELERSVMIRKSLASRASSYSIGSSRILNSPRNSHLLDDIPAEEAEGETGGLNEDWKEWEARVRKQRTNSLGQGHPALSPPLEQLAIPQQSRGPSPATMVAPGRSSPRLPLPPAPPQYGRPADESPAHAR
ncbi:uncharacterized protein BCR38DRAFT_450738 [Pseudomassariella vexata]|uniref:Uncharacterized protein n=1 Tax=Pseudomassariella vexata TaxID=1141098 RepID=A0A1Y2DBP2_9PEZI|nr:uncharacterized protein BCR38DRAFT_450738 [Pseudomassariella vexata]ORY56617.1 hypothetical protein BCR38DRAFT_450738 [Pseudomassariella vexata]